MLYPDAKQRMILGWQIRWIAGLVSLLILAAGAIPATASEGVASLLDAQNGSLFAVPHAEGTPGSDRRATTSEFLISSSDWEPDLEDDQTDVSDAPMALFLSIRCESRCTARHDEESARPAFEPGLLSPRSPPRN